MLGLFISYFYLSDRLTESFENNLKTNLNYRLSLGKNFIESKLGPQNTLADPIALANTIGQQQNLRTTIITMDGTVLADSFLKPYELKHIENHLHRPEIQQALIYGLGSSKRYSKTIGRYLLYMAVIFGKDHPAGFLRYAVPISSIDILEGAQQKIIIGSLILIFILSLGFTFIISLVVTRPLVAMAGIAKSMAKGDFSQKPYIYSNDEIGDMAKAMSYMSDQIHDKIDEIRRETLKLNTIISSMSEGLMVIDEKRIIVLMNLSLRKLFLVDSNPEQKASIEVIRNPQILDIVDRIIKERHQLLSEEVDISYPQEKILRVNASPIIRNDILKGAVLVFHDITQVRKLERMRRDFMANVSHELRTPITSIKGYSETLLEGAIEDKDRAKEFINIIHQNSKRLEALINDLLDLAAIESNKMTILLSPLDITPIIERCVGVFKKSIKDKGLSLSVLHADNIPKVLADEKRITQVLLNLLDNAVKFTNTGGITVRISLKDKLVQIDITDTGIGILPNDIPRIFERFYRVEKSRSRDLGGTGLGLSIVKHIVESHQGEIWVSSNPGQGSTFSVTIPQA
jgi:two-component system phosphate regulon sensor histidine kinase PhoR